MNKTDKTKEELSVELEKLRQENAALKIQHEKDISERLLSEEALTYENNFQLDKKQMYLIVYNLLSNAIKFSSISSKVEIRLIVESKDFIIEVSDQGIGIQPEEKDEIFRMFFRGTNAKNIPGIGLGLSIVKRAVDHHSGV